MHLKSLIRTIPHYPRQGVMFRDITTLLSDGPGFKHTIQAIEAHLAGTHIDKIAAIESRGFIIGAALAYPLAAGFVPLRKRGKLPGTTVGRDYHLEYGADRIEMHVDAIKAGERVLLVDDLIATGGTASAAAQLIESAGGTIVQCCFVIDLPDLGGRARLEALGHRVYALMEFEGD
jgi:adenine phosphoribosyltransferase